LRRVIPIVLIKYEVSNMYNIQSEHYRFTPKCLQHKKHKGPDSEFTRHPNLPTSLDITNLYSNIPVKETRTVLANILKHSMTDPQTQHKLWKWYDIITRQNYFINNQDIVIQHDGLAMGAPSSGFIAEIFLQHTKHTHLTHKHSIIHYFHHVHDILIFNPIQTVIQAILGDLMPYTRIYSAQQK